MEGPRSVDATWTGVCSTWNQGSWSTGAGTSAHCDSVTPPSGPEAPATGSVPGIRSCWSLAEVVASHRQRYFAGLQHNVAEVGQRLLGTTIELGLSRRLVGGPKLKEALEHRLPRDRERALTHAGPHRADFSIRVAGRSGAGPGVSRPAETDGLGDAAGAAQMRRAAWGPTWRRYLWMIQRRSSTRRNLERLISEVLKLPAPALRHGAGPGMPAFQRLPDGRRFHVEHGKIAPSAIIRRHFEPGIP